MIAFPDKAAPPTDEALASALGELHPLWQAIAAHVRSAFPAATSEWKYSGAKFGWSFRLRDSRRNLVYMLPADGYVRVSLVFGDRAAAAVEASGVPEPVKAQLRQAKRYAEGRGLVLEVRSADDVATVRELVDIKLAH